MQRRRKDSLIGGAQSETTHRVVSNLYNTLRNLEEHMPPVPPPSSHPYGTHSLTQGMPTYAPITTTYIPKVHPRSAGFGLHQLVTTWGSGGWFPEAILVMGSEHLISLLDFLLLFCSPKIPQILGKHVS